MKQLFTLIMLVSFCTLTYGQGDARTRGSGGNTSEQPAQTRGKAIAGRVLDATGEPVIGATVAVINGKTGAVITGTYTDADGNFRLNTEDNADYKLRISNVGYKQSEYTFSEDLSNLQAELQEDLLRTEEVLVVGYGSANARDVTGSISKVEGSKIAQVKTPGFDQALQGRAAGVQVTTTSGRLGDGPTFRIRGTNSASLSSDPLIVIDGVPTVTGDDGILQATNNILNNINPNDIESTEFLKDAASAAIYGSRAANGVVLITTKRGKAGKTQVNFESSVGFQMAANRYNMLNAQEFTDITNEMLINAGSGARAVPYAPNPNTDTDWQKQITRTGFQHNNSLSIAGGNDKTRFFVSIGYSDIEGYNLKDRLRRATTRFNVDNVVNSWLKVGASLGYARTVNNSFNGGENSIGTPYRLGLFAWPNVPARNDQGGAFITVPSTNRLDRGSNTFSQTATGQIVRNPLGYLDLNRENVDQSFLDANAYVEIKPYITGLTWRTQYGISNIGTYDDSYWNNFHGESGGVNTGGIAQDYFTNRERWNLQTFLTYERDFADHNVSGQIGYEAQQTDLRIRGVVLTNFTDVFFQQVSSGSFPTAGILGVDGFNTKRTFESIFGRVGYRYKGKYMAQLNYRSDAISDFDKANRRGNFYGASVGWNFTEEEFFKNLGASFINRGKIKASWGSVGNAGVGTYAAFPTYTGHNSGAAGGLVYNAPGNTKLKWETSTKLDIGIELTLLNERISFVFDYFRNESKDLIFAVQQPRSLGLPTGSVLQNIGSLRNQGYEITINTVNMKTADFRWTSSFNFTAVNNRITELFSGLTEFNTGAYIVRIGEPLSTFNLHQYHGVNPNNGNPQWIDGPTGRIKEYTMGGTLVTPTPWRFADDGSVAPAVGNNDRKAYGVGAPTFSGGIDNNFTYKGFDLSIFIVYSGGNKIYNSSKTDLVGGSITNKHKDILRRWTTPGQQTDIPRLFSLDNTFENFATSHFLEPGDFVRLRNVTLGYTFSKEITSKLKVNSLRLYLSGTNLAVWTKYSGIDPEANRNFNDTVAAQNQQVGEDYLNMPQARTFLFGINVGF